MSATGRRLTPVGRGSRPSLVVTVVPVEAVVSDDPASTFFQWRELKSVSVCWSFRDHGRWTGPMTAAFGDHFSFWRWIDELARRNRRATVFAPIASDALTLLRFWERLDAEGCEWHSGVRGRPGERDGPPQDARFVLRRLVLRGRPDVVEYRHDGCPYLWLSGRQFYDTDEQTLFSVPGVGQGAGELDGGGVRRHHGMPAGRAARWHAAALRLCDWWASLDAGPLPRTLPGGAMQFLRSRQSIHKIVVHREEQPYRLEREACHGGRATCWFYGRIVARPSARPRRRGVIDRTPDPEIRGPVHRLDVRSMYPSLMRDKTFPQRLEYYTENATLDKLKSYCECYHVVARVSLDTPDPEYPYRSKVDVTYPTGRFRTALCGPELARALADNIVTHVHAFAAYAGAAVYSAAASALIVERTLARERGTVVHELLVKALSNSLAGKLAQRPVAMVRRSDVAPESRWGEWTTRTVGTEGCRRFRSIAGLTFELTDSGVGSGTTTAGFAFLASYGRYLMREIRSLCPHRSVISQDTDGLWITQSGLDVLRSRSAFELSAIPGRLQYECRSETGEWWSARHYHTDHGWVLSGFCRPELTDTHKITDTVTTNPVRHGCDGPPSFVREQFRDSSLHIVARGGDVGPDGWLTPHHLPRVPGTHSSPPPSSPPDSLF